MKQQEILKIAHRGAMSVRTENTIASFQAAIEEGFDGIELDVQACASGEIVVFHDDSLERLTGVRADVASTNWQQISQLEVEGEPIPLLRQAVKLLPATTIIIELKGSLRMTRLLDILTANPKHQYIIISKQVGLLEQLAHSDRNALYPRGLVSNKRLLLPTQLNKRLKLSYFITHHWCLNWFMTLQSKKQKCSILVYPVNSSILVKIVSRHSVRGIMLDALISD